MILKTNFKIKVKKKSEKIPETSNENFVRKNPVTFFPCKCFRTLRIFFFLPFLSNLRKTDFFGRKKYGKVRNLFLLQFQNISHQNISQKKNCSLNFVEGDGILHIINQEMGQLCILYHLLGPQSTYRRHYGTITFTYLESGSCMSVRFSVYEKLISQTCKFFLQIEKDKK